MGGQRLSLFRHGGRFLLQRRGRNRQRPLQSGGDSSAILAGSQERRTDNPGVGGLVQPQASARAYWQHAVNGQLN